MDFYCSVSFFDGVKCFGNFPTVGMLHGGCIEIGVDNFHHTIPLAGVQDFLDNCHSDYVVDYDNFLNSLPLWRKCELDVTLNEFLFKYNQRITKILNLINGDYFDSFDVEPCYPFGYGLSYSNFQYSTAKISADKLTADGKLTIKVNVANTANVKGEETVQLYIRDLVGSVSRPLKELKGFEKIVLNPGEFKEVSFEINEETLSLIMQ